MMAYLPDPNDPAPFVSAGPDPFSSLAAAPARRQSWLVEFLKTPFQDIDTRASYFLAKKRQAAVAAAR
jgi:hypothetical protein